MQSFLSPLLADAVGDVFIVVSIVAIVGGLIGFWVLSRFTPPGTLLAVAACLYVASWLIPAGGVRELHGLIGLTRLLGFIGGILGVIDLIRRRPQAAQHQAAPAEVVEAEVVDDPPPGPR